MEKQSCEIQFKIISEIPDDWIIKFNNYNSTAYISDIKKYGIKLTWNYLCEYFLSKYAKHTEFLNVSNFAELYEMALDIENKKQKKSIGHYCTPDDVANVMAEWFDNLKSYNICDVCCGTGRLILSFLKFIGTKKSTELLENGRIYLYDCDETALRICVTSILSTYGLKYANKIHAFACDFLNKKIHLPTNCKVISNPPYSEITSIPKSWANTQIQQKTKELYSSFMEKILQESCSSVIITPYSFIGGNKFYLLRLFMNKFSGFIVSFDNVPGNIFNGKKLGVFNTNTSNSVRAAITVVDNKNSGFRLSPLLRFKNSERARLLNCKTLESILSTEHQIIEKNRTKYAKISKSLQKIYDVWITKSSSHLENYICSGSIYTLYMPNTCRYFTTASSYELNRTGKIKLSFNDRDIFNYIYCFLNSSFAYWWWRIFDGGITYSLSLLYNLPTFYDLLSKDDKKFFANICNEMNNKEKTFIITKINAGKPQENIKFPIEYRNQINERLLKILGFNNLEKTAFETLHKNNFFGELETFEE